MESYKSDETKSAEFENGHFNEIADLNSSEEVREYLLGNDLDAVEGLLNASKKMYRDEMTGVYNRRKFSHWHQENAHRDDLIYIACDLDGLKRFNDARSHQAGDELLTNFTSLMNRFVDRLDSDEGAIFRMGGDEFLAVVRAYSVTKEELIAGLKRMRQVFALQSIDISRSEEIQADLTIGIAPTPEDAEIIATIVKHTGGAYVVEASQLLDDCGITYDRSNGDLKVYFNGELQPLKVEPPIRT